MSIMAYQTSLKSKVRFTGKGLHCGRIVHMDVCPAKANTGIIFHRTDDVRAEPVAAHAFNISSTSLSTTIGHGVSSVSTIEHIMAALAGLGISNAIIKLNAPEVPIMDGSSGPFVKEFLSCGIEKLGAPQKVYKVKKSFEIKQGDQYIRVEPSQRPQIQCKINFPYEVIGEQTIDYKPSADNFARISQARTFCHIKDVNYMKENGLALGGSLENAIVISDDGLLNSEGLRSNLEFVEHKLLDLVGDMALLGAPILGKISVSKPGHSLHAAFTRALLENESDLLEEVHYAEVSSKPKDFPKEFVVPVFASLG